MEDKQKFRQHLKLFLMSHQMGEDPGKFIAKVRQITIGDPASWDGKIPKTQFQPDQTYCKFVESSKSRPIVPWWWYAQANEPVPAVAEPMYETVRFDFVLIFPGHNTWMYFLLEPSEEVLSLLRQQDHMRAFILISLINKNLKAKQREIQRVRLGSVMHSNDLRKILTFVAMRKENPLHDKMPGNVPRVVREVDPSTRTTSWEIYLPDQKLPFDSFQDILELL